MHCWNGFLVASGLLLALGAPPRAQQEGEAPPVREVAGLEEPRAQDAEQLFARFARMPGLEVTFREEKHLALLALPLESRGRLYFMPPGYLARRVETPTPSELRVTPDELRMLQGGVEEVLDLHQNRELRIFITSLVQVFAGQHARLCESFEVRYRLDPEDDSGWSLELVPRAMPLTEMMKSLRLAGSGAAVLRIEMHEPNGDRTLTHLLRADPARHFDEAEQRALFGIERADAQPDAQPDEGA